MDDQVLTTIARRLIADRPSGDRLYDQTTRLDTLKRTIERAFEIHAEIAANIAEQLASQDAGAVLK
jgi:hypothetical protein